MQRNLLAGLCFALLFVSPSFAAKLYINEYGSVGTAVYATGGSSGVLEIAQEPGVPQTPVDFTSAVAPSAAFGKNTSFILIQCDTQCSWVVGPPGTVATTANMPLAAFLPLYIGVNAGQIISVIAHP